MTRHEIPTKLEVEDTVVFGLTARQLFCMGMGIALGYVLFQRAGHLTLGPLAMSIPFRICLGALPVGIALAFSFVRPADRTLETWVVALLQYACLPKRCVWRPIPAATRRARDTMLALPEDAPASDAQVPDAHEALATSDAPIGLRLSSTYDAVRLGDARAPLSLASK